MSRIMGIVITVMVAAGAFGGLINYFVTVKSDPENASIRKSVIIGIGASFLVPLFLNMISSNLIDLIKGTSTVPGDSFKLLVFAGFCLVAAISSTAFIQTITDRVLSEAKAARQEAAEAKADAEQAKDQVAQVQANVEPIIERETEPEAATDMAAARASTEKLSDAEKRILTAFARSTYTKRSLSGLSTDTGIPIDELEILLDQLAAKGLTRKYESNNKHKWLITHDGLRAAVSY